MTTIADLADDAALYGVGVVRRPPRESLDRYVAEALTRVPAARDERVRDAACGDCQNRLQGAGTVTSTD
ncbi:MAG TPA: hypothetical protein VNG31_01270 [Candidatus Baltobacteraceae bacterium]|nr:hypothetical protein [Candidatus Baltobacteraceae bacterium]